MTEPTKFALEMDFSEIERRVMSALTEKQMLGLLDNYGVRQTYTTPVSQHRSTGKSWARWICNGVYPKPTTLAEDLTNAVQWAIKDASRG